MFLLSLPLGPSGWSRCWYDISTNVQPKNLNLLLGGEMSMWSDTYCYICQSWPRRKKKAKGGAPLFQYTLTLFLSLPPSLSPFHIPLTAQCGVGSGATPVGAPLFPPSMDEYFSRSIGGMVWPRGYVAAGAFWNYNASVDPTSSQFVQQIFALNDELEQRGSYVCPSQCSCDQLTYCGKPYVPQTPPQLGANLTMQVRVLVAVKMYRVLMDSHS